MSKEMPYGLIVENVDDGVNITIEATDGMLIDLIDQPTNRQTDRITLHIRNTVIPRVGSCVTVSDGSNIRVAGFRYSDNNNLWILDEDTRVWHQA